MIKICEYQIMSKPQQFSNELNDSLEITDNNLEMLEMLEMSVQ